MTQGAHDAIKSLDNPFWRYSLAVYQQENCPSFLLHAQNTYGMNINVLLFIGWLAHQNRQLVVTPQFTAIIPSFQKEIIERIRGLRIRIKGFNNQTLYSAIKDLELKSEFFEQQRLFRCAGDMPRVDIEYSSMIENSLNDYWNYKESVKGGIKDKNWLQTLIQYLQPVF